MLYQEFQPSDLLKPYVKCYYLMETSSDLEDKAFATGCIEIMFNLGTGYWQVWSGNQFVTNPSIELWGQIIEPLAFRSIGHNVMLGARFFPHTAAFFLSGGIQQFNDGVADFSGIGGKAVQDLHAQLLEVNSLPQRLELLETYLLTQLAKQEKSLHKLPLLNQIMQELQQDNFFEQINQVARRQGISSRYLQKIFLQYTGLSPKLYSKIHRFQNSLLLVAQKESNLTNIAYDCGYFDQSHFIRDFKTFTGFSPSAFSPEGSSALLISPNK
jgi:AraC-like DNA-binding protein